jgi:hypothetical protein
LLNAVSGKTFTERGGKLIVIFAAMSFLGSVISLPPLLD